MKEYAQNYAVLELIDDSEIRTKCLFTDMIRRKVEAANIAEGELINPYCFTCSAKKKCRQFINN